MPRETMTPRERWLAVLEHKTPDRTPMDIWATSEAMQRLLNHLGCDEEAMISRLNIDRPLTVGGRYSGPPLKEGQNIWGIDYRSVDYGSGQYNEAVSAPLANFQSVEEIDAAYNWPKPQWWTYDHLPSVVAGQEHRPIRGGGSEPFLMYKLLRGEAQAYMDLVLNGEIVDYCLDKLFDLAYEDTRRIFEAIPGKVIITYVAEDLGGQESLLISRQHIQRYLLPRMKRMVDLTHQAGSYVFTHTDGAVREVLPDLIEMGSDVLNPIQWRCPGMEREGLKRDFGDKLVFHGGVDNQHTLPFGSVDDVRQEVRDNLRILGAGGGYILAPCHNIQANTPSENVVAMYETGYQEGWL